MDIRWGLLKENRISTQAPLSKMRLLIGGGDRIVFFSYKQVQVRIMNPWPRLLCLKCREFRA